MTMPGTPLGASPLFARFNRDEGGRDTDLGVIRANGLEVDVAASNPETVFAAGIAWLSYLQGTESACPEYAEALAKALEVQTYLTRRHQRLMAEGTSR